MANDKAGDTESVPESVAGGDVSEPTVQREVPADVQAKLDEAKEPVVIYSGDASVRQITKEQWAGAGVDQETATWTRNNGFAVKKSTLSSAALDILAADGSFKIPG